MSSLVSTVASLPTSTVTAANVTHFYDQTSVGLQETVLDRRCRYRGHWYPAETYRLITCAYCYLFVYKKTWRVTATYPFEIVVGENGLGERLRADLSNETAVSQVCSSLKPPEECKPWKTCCKEAEKCCERQLKEGPGIHPDHGKTVCPRTWDGFACWSDTSVGRTESIECPSYVPDVFSGTQAYKTCTTNGTWLQKDDFEWTDYSKCNTFEEYRKVYTASLACNTITIILVLPACFIFLYFRQLRHQHRIRLHICLMLSSFLTSASMITWDLVIASNRMTTANKQDTFIHQNSIACRVLQLTTRYANMAAFMWMFIEGFHLHRLLVHAFSVPKSLLPYYILGYGIPCVPITIYAAIRATDRTFNKACWTPNADYFEWLLYAPILLSLLVNVFFMVRIVHIMVNQLEPHPNEPSTFRRAVKAVGVLMPLFGIQFLLFVYRPGERYSSLSLAFEMTSKICSSLQGAFIAIVFCYMNKEVRGYLKASFTRIVGRTRLGHDFASRSLTLTTQYPSDVTRTRSVCDPEASSQMIPLKPVYTGSSKGGNCHATNGDVRHAGCGDELEDDRLLDSARTLT